MRDMRMTHRCAGCVHYTREGISDRCNLESNTYQNWLGMMYKEHPDQKNLRGRCQDYKPRGKGKK